MQATNGHLPPIGGLLLLENPPSCQILTSPPVQSQATPGKQGRRQWWRKPRGRWLWALASDPRPSLLLMPSISFTCCHLSLSTRRGKKKKKHAVSQSLALRSGGKVKEKKATHCAWTKRSSALGSQPCVSAWVQEANLENSVCHPCGQPQKTCNRSHPSQWDKCWLCLLLHMTRF